MAAADSALTLAEAARIMREAVRDKSYWDLDQLAATLADVLLEDE